MDEILDQGFMQNEGHNNVAYGSFWQRLGASLLDLLILAPVTMGLTYLNITNWKSSSILIALTLLGIGYKPFMEASYGATLGKMALKLKVTNLEFETANIGEILLRNIFHIVPSLLSLFITIKMFNDPDFGSVSGYGDFSTFGQRYSMSQYVNTTSGLITIVDAIVLMVDQQSRSLHDKIAGTVVILKKE